MPLTPLPIIPALPNKLTTGTSPDGTGVSGQSNSGTGVVGECIGPPGLWVASGTVGVPTSDGVLGVGKNGVHGQTISATDCGVLGENLSGIATANGGAGVRGTSELGYGVYGSSGGDGVADPSTLSNYAGVYGVNTGNNNPGVFGFGKGKGGCGVLAVSVQSWGLWAQGSGGAGNGAAWLDGAVTVSGDLTISGNITTVNTINVAQGGDIILAGADCAEHFDTTDARELDPGTVVVIDQEGALRESRDAYDKKVAGVISGAGDFRPAIMLDNRASERRRALVALVGKVYCKVDASSTPIEVGDLLTPSSTPGHAMKACDPNKAFGAVIGKALGRLEGGLGLIPMLIALQ